jgi:hypothetical protein
MFNNATRSTSYNQCCISRELTIAIVDCNYFCYQHGCEIIKRLAQFDLFIDMRQRQTAGLEALDNRHNKKKYFKMHIIVYKNVFTNRC